MKTVSTKWELRSYDVWGNKNDGYEVNDSYVFDREYEIDIPVEINNAGTTAEFLSAYPTDKQIKAALDIKPRVKIATEGDDTTIYVTQDSTGYPLGEMVCVSHASLSPIKER